MVEFYTWHWAARSCLTFLIVCCLLAQTLVAILAVWRYPSRRIGKVENLMEFVVLAHILCGSLLHGQVIVNYALGTIPPTGYIALRNAVFIASSATAVALAFMKRTPRPLLVLPVLALTLPIAEAFSGKMFPWLYIAAFIILLARGVVKCAGLIRELKTGISALSVKNAIDTLQTGAMFYEPDGTIILINNQMQDLMKVITGKIQRSGRDFYELLVSEKCEPGCRKTELEGGMVYLLPDGSARLFTKTDISVKNKNYVQLTASEVTERWDLTENLRSQNTELVQKSESIKTTLLHLYYLSHAQETQAAKMRAHDVLGQRLTVILRAIRCGRPLGREMLEFLSTTLLDELKTGKSELSPHDEINGLSRTFESIGVEVSLEGELPEDTPKAALFVDVIRECITNAVRHGFATKVFIYSWTASEIHHLMVTNNGYPPRSVVEGGGIAGMREKIKTHGGALDIESYPRFVLTVELPEVS